MITFNVFKISFNEPAMLEVFSDSITNVGSGNVSAILPLLDLTVAFDNIDILISRL